MNSFPGRLNLFQATMLDWRDLHPYNAVHAARIAQPFDDTSLVEAIAAVLARAGLTGLDLDRAHCRYAWRGGAAEVALECVDPGSDWHASLERTFERQLNAPFTGTGRSNPFRFFAMPLEGEFVLGLAYDHFIAGGDSIVALLNAIADRYAGFPDDSRPLDRYPPTHWRLFARHPWRFIRGVRRLPAMAASCRRTIRPRYRSFAEGRNGFTFFALGAHESGALRDSARRWGVTLNDALIALLLLAQDARMPPRDRTKGRHELAVASIMNLRDAHRRDARSTFGQFLSSFRVSHPVPPGITLQALAGDVHVATARIKQEKLFLTTLGAMAVDRVVARFQSRERRMAVYAKSYPVGAGVSSLNVGALWESPDGSDPPFYVRGVPTGPASPLVVAVTTSKDTLCAGISYRVSAFGPDEIDAFILDIRHRIDSLK